MYAQYCDRNEHAWSTEYSEETMAFSIRAHGASAVLTRVCLLMFIPACLFAVSSRVGAEVCINWNIV